MVTDQHGGSGHSGAREWGRLQNQPARPTDAEVIARSTREPGWFGVIFDRHAAEILRYAHARLGRDLAEDVTAETFLAAFGRREHYDTSRADSRPWLYGIAVRQIGKHRRDEARRLRMLRSMPAELWADDISDRSAERVTAEELRPQLAALLSSLSRQDREVLLLTAWGGLSYTEVAAALSTTVSAVKSRLNRVRARTRKALGGTSPAHIPEETRHG